MGDKTVDLLLNLFGFGIGQLIVRINTLDGSLDKPWLLLPPFWIFPLSIVPTVYIYLDKITKGKGGSPIDMSLYIIILGMIISNIMIDKLGEEYPK